MDKLPEKWCIKRTGDNFSVINSYFNKNGCFYQSNSEFIHFPNYRDFNGFKYGDHCGNKRSDYTEISFDDFKRLVLNQNVETKQEINNNYLTF